MAAPIRDSIPELSSLAQLRLDEHQTSVSSRGLSTTEAPLSLEDSQARLAQYELFCLHVTDGIVRSSSPVFNTPNSQAIKALAFLDTLIVSTLHSEEFLECLTAVANDLGSAKTTIFSLAKSQNDFEDHLEAMLGNSNDTKDFFALCDSHAQAFTSQAHALNVLQKNIQPRCLQLPANHQLLFSFLFETLSFIQRAIFKGSISQTEASKIGFEVGLKQIMLVKIMNPDLSLILDQKSEHYFHLLTEISLKLAQRESLASQIQQLFPLSKCNHNELIIQLKNHLEMPVSSSENDLKQFSDAAGALFAFVQRQPPTHQGSFISLILSELTKIAAEKTL